MRNIIETNNEHPMCSKYAGSFTCTMNDDSMLPIIERGDTLVVTPCKDVESGRVALVKTNQDTMVIRYVVYSTNGMFLLTKAGTYNGQYYSCEEMKQQGIEIVGRVVAIQRDF